MDFLLLTITFAAGLLIALVIWAKLRTRSQISHSDRARIRSHWSALQQKIQTHPATAIVDADKLLDLVLTKKGYRGSLGAKLRTAGKLFTDQNAVWSAHKLRNQIAHEVGYVPTTSQVRRACKAYRVALGDLGIKL